MKFSILTSLLALASSSLAAVQNSDGSFVYSGAISGDQVTITIKGAVASDSYIAFGVPASYDAPAMIGADVYIAYPVNSGATVLEGMAVGNPAKTVQATTSSSINIQSAMSSYSNGVLTAVFTRPLKSAQGLVIGDGNAAYLWATGKMSSTGTSPTKHTAKGVMKGNLIGTGTAVVATTPAGTNSTKPNSAMSTSAWTVGLTGLVSGVVALYV
ncbi:hypothetical protein HDU97_001513 [Phlyctochytrium planicorne]|nr:hypothetical protein HDU97_001513 [Phlyctochytrium planicorne]